MRKQCWRGNRLVGDEPLEKSSEGREQLRNEGENDALNAANDVC